MDEIKTKHKVLRYSLFTLFGILLLVVGVYATTIISDQQTSTPYINASNILYCNIKGT